MKSWVFLLILAVLLAACGEEPMPDPGDPLPNVEAGMLALYSGDLGGVNTYFCEALLLDARRIANEAALGEGRLELRNTEFKIHAKQAPNAWTITLNGVYAIWLHGQAQAHDTAQEGAVYIGVRVEDDIWKICGFGADPTPTP